MDPAAKRYPLAGVRGAKLTGEVRALGGGEERVLGQIEWFIREWLNLALAYTWWKKLQQTKDIESPAKTNLLNLTPDRAEEEVRAFINEIGEKPFRVGQIARHLWTAPVPDFASISTIPAALRESLTGKFSLPRLELAMRQKSADGTEKFLFRLQDGEFIETVA
ncbi:MAG: hypothetical protein M3Z17_10045, partial [Gemmatimonadota bacterium]|nr:hypothetical protein [Gemmatimonadota bacterium]